MVENGSTRNLEAYARTRGLWLSVRRIDGRKAGLFFITARDGKPLKQPKPIGHRLLEAELWIHEHRVKEPAKTRGVYS